MQSLLSMGEALTELVPLPVLDVWGRLSYFFGFLLLVCAFGGVTFRVGTRWVLGRDKQHWNGQAFLAMPITFLLVLSAAYVGSFIPLVHGAQTFESLKDLMLFLCVVLFGYPAILTAPFAYAISDIIEGVPPEFLWDWLPGYFINPAYFWLFLQSIGKDPDFRKIKTWVNYLLTVVVFMIFEPVMWGYICSERFTPALSFGQVTPALFLTMSVTWLLAPPATLIALPLARRFNLFWAEIQGHVEERTWAKSEGVWVSGPVGQERFQAETVRGVPLRVFLLAPLVLLALLMVGATALVTLKSGKADATRLAKQLNKNFSKDIARSLRAQQEREGFVDSAFLGDILSEQPAQGQGRVFVLDEQFDFVVKDSIFKNPAVIKARRLIDSKEPILGAFTFQVLNASPLALNTWLGHVEKCDFSVSGRKEHWYIVSLLPEQYFLSNVQAGNSQAASVFALTILLALVAIVWLGTALTEPLREMSIAASLLASGDLSQRTGGSRLKELEALSTAFNAMAEQMENSIDSLVAEVEQRKVAEQELMIHREQLEKVVEQRTHDLSVALDESESASRAKGAFLAHMSHEIRTPLNAVLVYTQLLKTDESLSESQRAHLDAIYASGEHLLELLNNILVMSRMEAQREQVNTVPFYLNELCERVLEMFYPMADQAGINLQMRKSCEVDCRIESDPGKIRQILVNLVSNALKFTQEGEIRLFLSCASEPDGRLKIVIEVSDDGCGIESDDLDRIFEPFDQLEEGTSKAGSGLGLAISRGFARLLDGDLTVESEFGKGATFRLSFLAVPVCTQHPPSSGEQLDGSQEQESSASEEADYTSTLRSLPAEVRSEVSEAAVQARLNRLLSLASKVDSEYPEAAQQLRELCTTFQFQALQDAVDSDDVDS